MKRMAVVALGIVLVLTGCENQAAPKSLPDGVTSISPAMRGIWKAPGGPGCRWRIRVKTPKGRWVDVSKGSGNRSQTAIIGSSHGGGEFRSTNCAPKGWTQ